MPATFALRIAIDPTLREELLSIPGVKVRGRSVSASDDVAWLLEQKFGVAPSSTGRARTAQCSVQPDAVRGWTKLYPYQQEDALAFARGERTALFGGTGTGKTPTLLAASALAGDGLVCVVTRAIGRESWARDAGWLGDRKVGILLGRAEAGDAQAVEPELERALVIAREVVAETTRSDDFRAGLLAQLERLLQDVVHGRKGAMLRAANRRLERLRERGSKCAAYVSADDALADGCDVVVCGWETLSVLEPVVEQDKEGVQRTKLVPRLRPDLRRIWSRVIFDEAHCAKGRLADRTQAAQELAKHSERQPWIATATPVRDRLRDLWAEWSLVDADAAGTSWKWCHRYLHAQPGKFGGLDTSGPHPREKCPLCAERLDELKRRLDHFVRVRTRAELSGMLPPLTRVLLRVPSSKAAQAASTGAARGQRGVEGALAIAAEAKLPEAVELVTESLTGGLKVVVVGSRVAWAPRALKAIEKGISAGVRERLWSAVATGAVEPTERVALAREYMGRRGPALLVGTLDAIGEAIDLQDTDVAICTQLPYTYGQVVQFEGRFRRPGQVRPVTLYYLIAEGTIDEEIERLVLSKFRAIEEVDADTEGTIGAAWHRSDEEVIAGLQAWLREAHGTSAASEPSPEVEIG